MGKGWKVVKDFQTVTPESIGGDVEMGNAGSQGKGRGDLLQKISNEANHAERL
jgi:hypothetical protein